MRYSSILTAVVPAVLVGCSTVPSVQYSYYPAKSNTLVTVTQAADCNSSKTAVVVVNSPAVTTAYSSDFSKPPYKINVADVKGSFADSDFAFTLYDDGRLKSINQSTTGQGETIIKSAVALATALAPLGGGAPVTAGAGTLPECTTIGTWGGGKPVTLTYSANINLTAASKTSPLKPASGSLSLYNLLSKQLPVLDVKVGALTPIVSGARAGSAPTGDFVGLTLQEIAAVSVEIRADGNTIWSSDVIIPGVNSFVLPIPKAALFGKQSFSMTLSEAGAITAIDYGKTTGVSGALNAAGAIATAAAPPSAATQAADVKAQADLIAQQQRLVRCQADPAKCQ